MDRDVGAWWERRVGGSIGEGVREVVVTHGGLECLEEGTLLGRIVRDSVSEVGRRRVGPVWVSMESRGKCVGGGLVVGGDAGSLVSGEAGGVGAWGGCWSGGREWAKRL